MHLDRGLDYGLRARRLTTHEGVESFASCWHSSGRRECPDGRWDRSPASRLPWGQSAPIQLRCARRQSGRPISCTQGCNTTDTPYCARGDGISEQQPSSIEDPTVGGKERRRSSPDVLGDLCATGTRYHTKRELGIFRHSRMGSGLT